jgi:hypothetical protein
MTLDTGLIGLYWSARKESLDQCSARCFSTLSCLRAHGFSSFYHLGRTRKEALKHRFELSLGSIRQLLKRGVHRNDIDRKPIPDLGYSFGLWSGGPEDRSYAVSSYCGSYSPFVGNSFLVRLPAIGPHSLPSLLPVMPALFRELTDIWTPDRAVVCDRSELRWDQGEFAKDMKAYFRHP